MKLKIKKIVKLKFKKQMLINNNNLKKIFRLMLSIIIKIWSLIKIKKKNQFNLINKDKLKKQSKVKHKLSKHKPEKYNIGKYEVLK